MTGLTGRTVQASGLCVGGTEAFVTVSNMGSLQVDLSGCEIATTNITGVSGDCGDLTVVRTDGGTMTGAGFDASSISPTEPDRIYKATFRDPGCTTSGVSATCRYAFTRAGEVQPEEVTIRCSG